MLLILVPSKLMCLFKSFVQLKKIGWFLLNFQEFCINISDVCATNIFFKLVIYWFTVSRLFWLADIFKFAEVELISFILVGSCPVLEICIFSRLWKYSVMFSPGNVDVDFTVSSMMDFGLIFEYGVRWDPHSFFPLYTAIYCSNNIY